MRTGSVKKIHGRKLWGYIKENVSFLAVLASTFVALALMVGLTFGTFYRSARDYAMMIGNLTVANEAQRIEDSLFPGINTLLVSGYTVDGMLEDGASADEIEDYLVQETNGIIKGMDPDFSGIYGVINGKYVDGIGWQPEDGYDPCSRPWYMAALAKAGELAIVSPYIDAQTGSVMISFSKLLSDGESAISLDVRLDNINEVTENIQLNGNGYCCLVDGMGQIIAHRDISLVGLNCLTDPSFDGSGMRSLILGIDPRSDYGTYQNIEVDGKNCMAFTHNVRNEWNVVLVVGKADLFRDIRTSLAQSILASFALFLLVGYFCTSNYRNRKRALRYAEDIRTDDLTGMNNRGEFDRYLAAATSGIQPDKKLYLLLFDADNFKSINDRYGHPEGDRALKLIAGVLMKVCGETDFFCARYGGDEFVIICQSDSEDGTFKVVSRLNSELETVVREKALPYALSMSCGCAVFDPSTQLMSDLLKEADRELYKKKAEKKKR